MLGRRGDLRHLKRQNFWGGPYKLTLVDSH